MQAFESTGGTESHSKGLWAELQVLQIYLKNSDFLFHRLRTPYCELDLGFTQGDRLIVVEVKSEGRASPEFRPSRMGARQKQRWSMALQRLRAESLAVEFHLAFVDDWGRVEVIEDLL